MHASISCSCTWAQFSSCHRQNTQCSRLSHHFKIHLPKIGSIPRTWKHYCTWESSFFTVSKSATSRTKPINFSFLCGMLAKTRFRWRIIVCFQHGSVSRFIFFYQSSKLWRCCRGWFMLDLYWCTDYYLSSRWCILLKWSRVHLLWSINCILNKLLIRRSCHGSVGSETLGH